MEVKSDYSYKGCRYDNLLVDTLYSLDASSDVVVGVALGLRMGRLVGLLGWLGPSWPECGEYLGTLRVEICAVMSGAKLMLMCGRCSGITEV